MIESPSNPRIKELVKLREMPRRRRERGIFVVDGGSDLIALAREGRKVQEIYFCRARVEQSGQTELFDELKRLGIDCTELSETAYSKACYGSVRSGILGLVETWDIGIEKFSPADDGLVVILDEVEKPGNLGAILRSVEAFGGGGVILSDPAVDFFNPNVIRSSRGLMGSLPVAKGTKDEAWEWLRNSHRSLIATSSHATQTLDEVRMDPPLAMLFGSEKEGLGEYWKNRVEVWVGIEMMGAASSLNLNVSVSCSMYEFNRRAKEEHRQTLHKD